MKILISPDSFKGTLTAREAAGAMANGVKKILPQAKLEICPLADGGEGTVDTLVSAYGGKLIWSGVGDPLGHQTKAAFGLLALDKKVVVIEMAAASGLTLLKPDERRPLQATTFGTGQLIKESLEYEPGLIIIGIGGSATSDGGVGLVQALGGQFLDEQGKQIEPGAIGLLKLKKIDLSGMDQRLLSLKIEVASDVQNPLLGREGAARVYGPQKGATPDQIELIEQAHKNLVEIAKRDLNINPALAEQPGAGAAGGLGFGLTAFLEAELKSGAEVIISAIRLSEKIKESDLVITGEGKIDYQTMYGKIISEVCRLAHQEKTPLLILAGRIEKDFKIKQAELVGLFSLEDYVNLEEALINPLPNLEKLAEVALKVIITKLNLNR